MHAASGVVRTTAQFLLLPIEELNDGQHESHETMMTTRIFGREGNGVEWGEVQQRMTMDGIALYRVCVCV